MSSWGKVGVLACLALGALPVGGCGSSPSGSSPSRSGSGAGKQAVETAGKLEIEANPEGQPAYTTNEATATTGTVTITMKNMSGVPHNVAIEPGEDGATAKASTIGASQTVTDGSASITVTLKPGTYTFFCQVPGHRTAGMWGTLTVK
jgi:uncharacterized cupredoxin-like copper-binding protein